ncbi:N-formylglutamate amidohydrolase [Komagataeibacter xylinus]|uniref:N-formylglutamate amidohydrolase n=1 Tax=Komagataeibacter xylinus TaxID=28448 RepID=A0A318PP41_KOMXY|nr:N-formylglutamate amidohydrolase [Komagataeibacter xylinus]PYD57966.1 N-formylglutamate amidohydrolase [Komagataeibacter xylinus]GBQ73951.1 putative N-formylglutamate amidohydrolase [Komagataeibacter xylinus NBRC 15237]
MIRDTEPSPPIFINSADMGEFVIIVDHAGNRVPASLHNLGLDPEHLKQHVGWDIGALSVARRVADRLKSPLIAQAYSRLVIDCNRLPGSAESILEVSEIYEIPGNYGLNSAERRLREETFLIPYHDIIENCLDTRARLGLETIILSIHSFTPVYNGVKRDMDIGILWGDDSRFSSIVLECLRDVLGEKRVAGNAPYQVDMEKDYTIPIHAEGRNIPYVEFEIRQDLIGDEKSIKYWADHIVEAVLAAKNIYDHKYGKK